MIGWARRAPEKWRALHWQDAIGSDERYQPNTGWFPDEKRAYAAGIRDAMRILEQHAWTVRRCQHCKTQQTVALKAMHHRAEEFEK